MKVEAKSIDEIKPYENNPRNNDDAVDAVANSIKEFGWQQPIVVDNEGVIIAGHTRYKAAQKLGLKTVPVVVAKDLTEKQVKAYRLADNKVGELADWNLPKLNIELDDINDIDMSDFGFDENFDDNIEENNSFGVESNSVSNNAEQNYEPDYTENSYEPDNTANTESNYTQSNTENNNEELDLNDFSDDKFDVVCPKCGFRFNLKR